MIKDKKIDITHKKPHSHNGTIVDLPSHLPSSKQGSKGLQSSDNQHNNKNKGHRKSVRNQYYGRHTLA